MNFLDDQFLDDILNEYHDGYAKSYKYIPDLVKALKAARKVVEAARRECYVDGNGYYSSHVSDDLHRAIKELDGGK